MRTETIASALEAGRLPDQEVPLHARRLKAALLASPRFARRPFGFSRIASLIIQTMTKKHLALMGVSAAVFAFVLFGAGKFGGAATPYAQAQEIVKAAQAQAFNLPSDAKNEIEASLQTSMDGALEEAQRAPDLRRMNPQEYQAAMAEEAGQSRGNDTYRLYAMNPAVSWPPPVFKMDGPHSATVESNGYVDPVTTYLVYTDPQGHKVILGLDASNVLRYRILESVQAVR